MPLKCLFLMMLIIGIMITPILALIPGFGWIADAGVLLVSIVGLLLTSGGSILKIFENK